jgi:hypothetical protein
MKCTKPRSSCLALMKGFSALMQVTHNGTNL